MKTITSRTTVTEGDSRALIIAWDTRNPREVAEAKRAFEDHVRQGWFAFIIKPDNRRVQVFEFKPEYGRVHLYPLAEGG